MALGPRWLLRRNRFNTSLSRLVRFVCLNYFTPMKKAPQKCELIHTMLRERKEGKTRPDDIPYKAF